MVWFILFFGKLTSALLKGCFGETIQVIIISVSFKRFACSYLNFLSINIKQSLSEVHADGGLQAPGELPGAESVCEAGLPHRRVSDHQDLEGPTAGQQRGHAAQRVGQLEG